MADLDGDLGIDQSGQAIQNTVKIAAVDQADNHTKRLAPREENGRDAIAYAKFYLNDGGIQE